MGGIRLMGTGAHGIPSPLEGEGQGGGGDSGRFILRTHSPVIASAAKQSRSDQKSEAGGRGGGMEGAVYNLR